MNNALCEKETAMVDAYSFILSAPPQVVLMGPSFVHHEWDNNGANISWGFLIVAEETPVIVIHQLPL